MNENDYILDFQDTRTVIEDHEYCLSTCSFEKKQRDTIQSFYVYCIYRPSIVQAIADTVEEAHSKLYAYLYLYLFNVTVPTVFVQFNSFFEPSIFFNCIQIVQIIVIIQAFIIIIVLSYMSVDIRFSSFMIISLLTSSISTTTSLRLTLRSLSNR